MAKRYDHRDKAGNQGDLVKHPALMAALDRTVKKWKEHCNSNDSFRYADAFAGQPDHPSLPSGHWRFGIGKLPTEMPCTTSGDLARWWSWYHSPRSHIAAGNYPGSSRIAFDLCKENECQFKLDLFDTCKEVQDELERHFAATGIATVHPRAALAEDDAIRNCDFLFIDPPGVKSAQHPSYPTWQHLKSLLVSNAERPTLMWLPATGRWTDDAPANRRARTVTRLGYAWSEVRWSQGGQGSGCVLVYGSIDIASLRSAVDEMGRIAGWGTGKFRAVRHSLTYMPRMIS